MQLTRVRLHRPEGRVFQLSESLRFEFEVLTRRVLAGTYVAIGIYNSLDQLVYWTSDIDSPRFQRPAEGIVRLKCEIPGRLLTPGRYSANFGIVMVGRAPIFAMLERRIFFEIVDRESILASHGIPYPGNCAIPSKWTCLAESPPSEEPRHVFSEKG